MQVNIPYMHGMGMDIQLCDDVFFEVVQLWYGTTRFTIAILHHGQALAAYMALV